MESLSPVKYDFLLDEALDTLHHESIEWLNDIAFWKNELAFFSRLLIKIEDKAKNKKIQDENIRSKIIYLQTEILEDLEIAVAMHEKSLSGILDNQDTDTENYRIHHKHLAIKFSSFKNDLNELKRSVFRSVETNKF